MQTRLKSVMLRFGVGVSDFSATVNDAITGPPSVGFWTDLSPNLGGSIAVSVTPTSVTTTYTNVPYFNQPTSAVSFSVDLDQVGVITLDVSGIGAHPLPSSVPTVGQAQWFGLTCGQGTATDPGVQAFAPGMSGNNSTNPTDMLYDYADGAMLQSQFGLLSTITALQGGTGILAFTPGSAPGEYQWGGF